MRAAAAAAGLLLAASGCRDTAAPATAAPAPARAVVQLPAQIELRGDLVQGGLVFGTAPAGSAALTLDGKPVALASDGHFLIGFDRDQPAQAVLEARLRDGRTLRRELTVAPRAWQIERVDVALRPSMPNADYLRLRETEVARIAAARAMAVESGGWRQRFVWPATGRVSGVFGSQRIYRGEPGSYHSGLDVAAGAGATVAAPADGVVILAGPPAFSLEGNLVMIAHGMGLNSAFLHLSRVDVALGQRVRQGDPIGAVGATGRATGPHLHWSLRWNEARIDPQPLLPPQGP